MPRAVKKEADEKEKKSKIKATSNSKKSTTAQSTTKVEPKAKTDSKSSITKVAAKKIAEVAEKAIGKKSTTKSTAKNSKSKTSKKTTTTVKKKTVKIQSLTTQPKLSTKKVDEEEKDFANVLEYYDLPYRYNETVVKILAQTPKVLFVYWDVSDNDREKYKEKYGEYFFNDTYPVLIVHNKTLNYYQEIEINDFANSWYISIQDSRSEYYVELGRRFKEYAKRNGKMPHKEDINSLIYVTESNNLVMPNDHVLLDEIKPKIKYRNVKTGEEFYKNTRTILANNELIDFYELYKGIYQVEDLSDFFVLNNPSSGNPTSTFK